MFLPNSPPSPVMLPQRGEDKIHMGNVSGTADADALQMWPVLNYGLGIVDRHLKYRVTWRADKEILVLEDQDVTARC